LIVVTPNTENQTMSVISLKRAIKQELVAEMQTNPWLIASKKTGLGVNDAKTRSLAIDMSTRHTANLRMAAYIFGDTYENQPIQESKDLMIEEGFELFSDEEGKMLYLHGSLGITAQVKYNPKQQLEEIILLCDMIIDENNLTPTSLTGLGAQGEIIGSRFNCTVDATCGLSTKMCVLRHLVTDGSLA
jgi:hypothetical protein